MLHLKVRQGDILSIEYIKNFYKEIRAMGIAHEDLLDLNIPLIVALAGRSIHESPDILFPTATWWVFNFVPNSDVLKNKVGSIFHSGLYAYW